MWSNAPNNNKCFEYEFIYLCLIFIDQSDIKGYNISRCDHHTSIIGLVISLNSMSAVTAEKACFRFITTLGSFFFSVFAAFVGIFLVVIVGVGAGAFGSEIKFHIKLLIPFLSSGKRGAGVRTGDFIQRLKGLKYSISILNFKLSYHDDTN